MEAENDKIENWLTLAKKNLRKFTDETPPDTRKRKCRKLENLTPKSSNKKKKIITDDKKQRKFHDIRKLWEKEDSKLKKNLQKSSKEDNVISNHKIKHLVAGIDSDKNSVNIVVNPRRTNLKLAKELSQITLDSWVQKDLEVGKSD